nr:MAG TPA: hypothetical protein [Caudoviricetes sp.]DAJ00708.1 MAG TPA: hypothetical protein [Caudoviricetes sp.]
MTEKFRGLLFGGLPIRIKTANVYLSGREALMNDLINAVGEKTALLDAAIRQLGKRGQAYAEAESNYRMALSKAILEERANGTPVTIISDICKGKSDIAKLRFQRDCAEVVYKSAMEAINSYKLQIRIMDAQIEREWHSG